MITHAAGVIEVRASLVWQSPDDVPQSGLLPLFPETVLARLTDSQETEETGRFITGELRALHEPSLTQALDHFLRTVTAKAALTDAVLEVRTFRTVNPKPSDAALVCGVARRLWDAGFRVTFGPSWGPVTGADLALGTGGSDSALEGFVREAETWEAVSSHP